MISLSSIIKDSKAIVNKAYLSTQDSELILLDLETEFSVHPSLDDVLESLQKNVYRDKKAIILKAILDDIDSGEIMEDVFVKYGLINLEESLIFSKSNSIREALRMVIDYRNEGSKFEEFLLNMLMPFLLSITATLLLIRLIGAKMKDYFQTELEPLFRMKTGFRPDIEFPYLIEHSHLMTLMIVLWVLFLVGCITFYLKIYRHSPEMIYKVSEIKFYDDFLKYFSIADKMKQVGATADDIFEFLSDRAQPEGLRVMFKELFEGEKDYYMTLERFHCPKRLGSIFRRKEANSTLWEHMQDEILPYARKTRDGRANFYIKYFSKPLLYTGFSIVVFTAMWLLLTFLTTIWALA